MERTTETPMNDFQMEIGQWGDETFKNATIRGMTLHLLKEARELVEALERWERVQMPADDTVVWPTVMEEWADCFMIACHIAKRKRFWLEDVVRAKFITVKAREWGEPDENGVVEHVR